MNMTEGEFNICTSPQKMLDFFECSGRASERKLRLFACACVRRFWDRLDDPRSRDAVLMAEGYADALITADSLAGIASDADEVAYRSEQALEYAELATGWGEEAALVRYLAAAAAANAAAATLEYEGAFVSVSDAATRVAEAAGHVTTESVYSTGRGYDSTEAYEADLEAGEAVEKKAQAALLRCIIGPLPFRTMAIEASWRTPDVLALARRIYEERDGSALAVLADALEEGGCADPDVLGHLRGSGPHAGLGCWPVDLLLNKD